MASIIIIFLLLLLIRVISIIHVSS